jgi:site-specific recombinase XerD
MSQRMWKVLQARLPISLFHKPPQAVLIFCQRGPLSEWGNHAIVKKYAYQARFEDVTAHTLRHNFAKNLVGSSTPVDQFATRLGHESLETTCIYTQPSERDLNQAVQRAAGEIIREDD